MSNCRDEHEEAGGDVVPPPSNSGGGGGGGGGHGHSHSHGHSHDCDHSCSHDDPDGDSLLQYVDTTRTKVLNSRRSGDANNAFKSFSNRRDREAFIESEEDDPELILHIPFTVAVNVKSICISGDADGSSPAQVKMFRDRSDIDFDLAHELKPTVRIFLLLFSFSFLFVSESCCAMESCGFMACCLVASFYALSCSLHGLVTGTLVAGQVQPARRPASECLVSHTADEASACAVPDNLLPGGSRWRRCVDQNILRRASRDCHVDQDDQQGCGGCQLRDSPQTHGERDWCRGVVRDLRRLYLLTRGRVRAGRTFYFLIILSKPSFLSRALR